MQANTGAPSRRAKSAVPRWVEAGRPKKGTNTPERRASWSATMPTMPPSRSTRGTWRLAWCISMVSTPSRRRSASRRASTSRFPMRLTMAAMGTPRAATAAAAISQLP